MAKTTDTVRRDQEANELRKAKKAGVRKGSNAKNTKAPRNFVLTKRTFATIQSVNELLPLSKDEPNAVGNTTAYFSLVGFDRDGVQIWEELNQTSSELGKAWPSLTPYTSSMNCGDTIDLGNRSTRLGYLKMFLRRVN